MLIQTMQVIHVHQYGGPEELKLEQSPRPEPETGEVLVRVYATGVLPIEWKIRQGFLRGVMPATFPYIPGTAFAGIIEEIGPGVTTFQPGQAVFGRSNRGAYAEYTTASVETITLKPETLRFDEAATISGGATNAWTALFENGKLQAGQRVLVHGAAGGVGLFAVQFAKMQGARVVATASAANVDFVRELGAEIVIDYTTTLFEQVVHDVDLVVDTIGGETLQRSMSVVKRGGTLVSLLEQPDQKKAQEYGIRALKNTATLPFPSTRLLHTIAQSIDAGQVKATIARTFPLAEAIQAQKLSQSGHGRGRIVLHIAD
jgi:NADPH:quinone reductase-like Zn-dependent oxidoreductase